MTDEITALLSNCAHALYCRRGEFYPKKDYGSRIRFSLDEDKRLILMYARQALADFDGVYVKSVSVKNGDIYFYLLINDEERTVTAEI